MSSTTERVCVCHFDGVYFTSYMEELEMIKGMLYVLDVCMVQMHGNDLVIGSLYDFMCSAV